MPTLEKQKTIEEIRDKLNSASIAILTEFQGINVADVTELRKNLRNAGIDYKVYKNTLIRLAAEQIGITGIEKYLVGTTALAVSQKDDLVAPAKLLKDFSAKHQHLKLKAGVLSNKAISTDDINTLINLPPKEFIISMLLGGMQAPISKFLGVLQAPMRDFVTVLKAIADKNGTGETQSSSEEPPATTDEKDNENKVEDSSDQQTTES